jgi:hypothetical protein
MKEKRRKTMKKKKDKVQEAINKYEIKFNAFMIHLNDAVKKDKAFKNIEGNMFDERKNNNYKTKRYFTKTMGYSVVGVKYFKKSMEALRS